MGPQTRGHERRNGIKNLLGNSMWILGITMLEVAMLTSFLPLIKPRHSVYLCIFSWILNKRTLKLCSLFLITCMVISMYQFCGVVYLLQTRKLESGSFFLEHRLLNGSILYCYSVCRSSYILVREIKQQIRKSGQI